MSKKTMSVLRESSGVAVRKDTRRQAKISLQNLPVNFYMALSRTEIKP